MRLGPKIINRAKRAEGQLSGVIRMMEDERECMDVVTQLSAVRSSIDRMIGIIVAENLMECINNPDEDAETQEQKIEQAMKLIMKK
ncbi:MAG TPA: metal-sensitive transcriptional regulator [Atopostipes sp.]|nr:metal-sensitive transcriptional regulator [Atopostipes sp.]